MLFYFWRTSLTTSGSFESSVDRIATERCVAKKHDITTGYPCALCASEVRLKFLTAPKTVPIQVTEQERELILNRLDF